VALTVARAVLVTPKLLAVRLLTRVETAWTRINRGHERDLFWPDDEHGTWRQRDDGMRDRS